MTENATQLRTSLAHDHHRPVYHFLPPRYWMNDPNGLIHWNGTYHIFYQHNPFGALWGNMSWGHATSQDLIHWQDLPLALEPTPGGADEAGCFSGCAVNNNGIPTIFYTSTRGSRNEVQTQSIATSRDGLLTWEKHPANPILAQVPPELGQTRDFRDPYVWKQDDHWYMVIGSRIENGLGIVLLYRSNNLVDWEYLNPLLSGTDIRHGTIWECPNFFRLGEKWVLIISAHTGYNTDTVFYFVGDFVNHRFIPEYSDVLDYGTLYAPLAFENEQGKRLMFGWLREARPDADQRKAGWSGVQSIPRELTLDQHNRLISTPIAALQNIRGKHHTHRNIALGTQTTLDVRSLHLDIEASFLLQQNGSCTLTLAQNSENGEEATISYDRAKATLTVRKVFREINGALSTVTREVPHELAADEPLNLRILLDGSVLELIANGRTSITSRIYPQLAQPAATSLSGSNAQLLSLDIWEMPSIWQ